MALLKANGGASDVLAKMVEQALPEIEASRAFVDSEPEEGEEGEGGDDGSNPEETVCTPCRSGCASGCVEEMLHCMLKLMC